MQYLTLSRVNFVDEKSNIKLCYILNNLKFFEISITRLDGYFEGTSHI